MIDVNDKAPSVLALSGGIGGAKLVLGLYHELAPWRLAIALNTGDDLEHMGLHVSPDVDTVMYTLAGESNQHVGWGRAGETWSFMEQTKRIGGPAWFNLGDGDMALHVRRTELLNNGAKLSDITAQFFAAFGVQAHGWPMSDQSVRTIVETVDGRRLPFQNYFVEERCEPRISGFIYDGATGAHPSPSIIDTLANPDLQAVVMCPSNPFVSIEPILSVPRVRAALAACAAPVIAVSPLVDGAAVKGPLAKMYKELGLKPGNAQILCHYNDFADGFVIDHADAAEQLELGLPVLVTKTVMSNLDDRIDLARSVLDFAKKLAAAKKPRQMRSGG